MKKATIISSVIIIALLLYLGFTLLFTWLFQQTTTARRVPGTPTPAPTFTPTPTLGAMAINTATPLPLTPTLTAPQPPPTSTPTASATPAAGQTPAATVPAPQPRVIAGSTVNVRAGPGTNYPVIGQLPPGPALAVTGRNEAGTWWQVEHQGQIGWVANSVVTASDTAGVAVAQIPTAPAPPATDTPVPAPPKPTYPYQPTGWYGDTNYGLTRFLGNIADPSGNPVNGVSVEAQCGDFRIISNPSGPVGWPPFYDSGGDPPGFYDITLDTKPIPCIWYLTVVETPDGKTVTARLSEAVEVETTIDQSIIVANWRKN